MYLCKKILSILLVCLSTTVFSASDNTSRSVWVNEAIVEAYTYNYKNYMDAQKTLARYFSAKGWENYSKALLASGLLEQVKKNNYFVSAVALMPPKIKTINNTYWKADMPVLVLYENPQFKQTQTINVTITFTQSATGIRGLAITSFQAESIKPPCVCASDESASEP